MRILIIEDDKNLAKILKIWLEKVGFSANYVINGESGEERIEARPDYYDLIILDLVLPGKSGFEICRKLRKQNIKIPVLIISSKTNQDAKDFIFELGATDYLTKPFSFGTLLEKIKAIVDEKI